MSEFDQEGETPAVSRTTTDPEKLSYGDRVILEAKINALDELFHQHVEEREKQLGIFYHTRMAPLEAKVVRVSAVAWFAAGFATAGFLLAVIVGIVVLWSRIAT